VLLGKEHPRIIQNGHDRVSTFGIGTFLTNAEWHSLYRQLIALGYIESDVERYGAIRLNPLCKPLLKGDETLHLRKQQKELLKQKSTSQKSTVRVADRDLFEALRALRKDLAEQQGVPPFVILHDKTLHELCALRPTTMAKVGTISGIGGKKLQLYGEKLIKVIEKFPLDETLDNHLSDTVNETLQLLRQGLKPDAIAVARELTENTVYNHLSTAIEAGLLELDQVLEIDKSQLDEIIYAMEMSQTDDGISLATVFKALDEKYDYPILKCVKASLAID